MLTTMFLVALKKELTPIKLLKRFIMIAFVHINKASGTTIKFMLRNTFGIHHCDTGKVKRSPFVEKDLNRAKKMFKTIHSIAGHNLVNSSSLLNKDIILFTFLREPVHRLASHYQDDVLRGGQIMKLEEWVQKNRLENLQTKMISGEDNADKAISILEKRFSFIGLTEKFDESVNALEYFLEFHYGIKLNTRYKLQNKAKDNNIKKELINKKESYEMLKYYNRNDLKLYEYVIENLFPNQIKLIPEEFLKKTILHYNHRTFHVYMSELFNKIIWRQYIKFFPESQN